MDSIMGTKKKKKAAKKTELIQIRVEVAKPGSKKYTHLDWEDLLKSQGKEKDEEALRRFYDEDTLNMHKKLGEMKTKSGKSLRVDLEYLLHMNRNAGYDMDDEFIDDSEAVDDQNFSNKKGKFYVGKGDLKAVDEDEEEEESEEEEEVEKQKKPRKRKEKTGTNAALESTSDSDSSEPVRMTGAPPTARMTGAPPTKKMLVKRPSPSTPQRKEPTPPKNGDEKEKEKKKHVEVVSMCSTSSDDEPPPKKKAVEASTSSENASGAVGAVATSPAKVVTKASTGTVILKKPEEGIKKPTTIPTTSSTLPAPTPTSRPSSAQSTALPSTSPSKDPSTSSRENVTAIITNMFTSLTKKGKEFKKNKSTVMDQETVNEIKEFFRIPQHHKMEKLNMENLSNTVASLFGLNVTELNKFLTTPVVSIKKEPSESFEWTTVDLPHLSEVDVGNMITIAKSWKSMKQLPNSVITTWLKEVNQGKLNVDQARVKLFDCVRVLPDLDKPAVPDTNQDLPKHERSRKARMFLHQWVYLSRKYVEIILPTLKKPVTDGYAKKQLMAANALKEALKKQQSSFETKKDKPPEAVYQFQFTEPVLASVWAYLDELVDYSLSIGKLDIIVTGIDSLHQSLDNKISLIQFYLELCRRLQKLSFLTVEEPMKTRLAQAKEHIAKHQVVQNPKYMIKWPGGEEPSMRGLNRELHSFETSILANWKPHSSPAAAPRPAPSTSAPSTSASTSSVPSTSSAPGKSAPASSTPLATRQPTDEERRAMNQIVQVYLGKYLLANGNSQADICDPQMVPMSNELLVAMVTAVSVCGVPLMNQMVMLKNVLAHVGQLRMAQAIAGQKTGEMSQLVTKQYQGLFDYFSKYEKAMDQKRLKEKDLEEKERRKTEERLKKEREKQMEKEKKEQEKREEKERKEKEKREEKERKEKEMREAAERRKQEEEDRRKAQEMLYRQMEDQRRKREAEQAVEKEMERRARMETEAESALQGLEEDNLMDDMDFVAEQQSREDEERKIAEAKRAVERENQIKMMRAKNVKQEVVTAIQIPAELQIPQEPGMDQFRDHETPSNSENAVNLPDPELQNQRVPESNLPSNGIAQSAPSTSEYHNQNPQQNQPQQQINQNHQNPAAQNGYSSAPNIKKEPTDSFDILSAAQEAAGLSVPQTPPVGGAFDKLASMRGRTMSADVRRMSENVKEKDTPAPPPPLQHYPQQGFNGSPQHFFPNQMGQEQIRMQQEEVRQKEIQWQQQQRQLCLEQELQRQQEARQQELTRQQLIRQQEELRQQELRQQELRKQELRKQELRKQQELRQQQQIQREQEIRQQELQRQQEMRQQELQRQQLIQQQQELRQQELRQQELRQQELRKQQELRQQQQIQREQEIRQQELQRQQEMRQQELQRQQELRRQLELRQEQEMRQQQEMRQAQELQRQQELRQAQELRQRQMQLQMSQNHAQQQQQQQQQRMAQNAGPSAMFFPEKQQQFPPYQSPNHHNSSLMHTPMSNGSMVPQSPQFGSHPSPMSQQFHTPPSVGMMGNNGHAMMNSSPGHQQHLQHFNYPHNQHANFQQQPQMHRQLSQQQLQMQQQQPHPMMRQMNHHPNNSNYPPQ